MIWSQNILYAVQTSDLVKLGKPVSAGIVWYQPEQNRFSGTHKGADSVFAMIGGMMEASPGKFKIDSVKSLMANGSNVAVTIEFSEQREGVDISMHGVDILTVQV